MPDVEFWLECGKEKVLLKTLHVSLAVSNDAAAIAKLKKELDDSLRCQYCKSIIWASYGHKISCRRPVEPPVPEPVQIETSSAGTNKR